MRDFGFRIYKTLVLMPSPKKEEEKKDKEKEHKEDKDKESSEVRLVKRKSESTDMLL